MAAALVLGLALAGCTGASGLSPVLHSTLTDKSARTSVAALPASCPSTYAQPDPERPKIALHFAVAADHAHVSGTEQVTFTPDRDITELVFRLTANTIPTYATGTQIRVTSVRADHDAKAATYSVAGAAPTSQGGLLHVPFATTVEAGTTVHADLAFALTLGKDSFDRFGYGRGVSWFASAQPLLAWERGYGWHTEPMILFPAESATSEAADTDLTVTAPSRDTVMMSGRPTTGIPAGAGRRSWHAHVLAARDVSVAVGPFITRDFTVGSTAVRAAGLVGADLDRVEVNEKFALTGLAKYFGPFPFPNLSVTLLPGQGGGIEYPSSTFLLEDGLPAVEDRLIDVHETAHQWFYAMVGDSQAQHAWLDEAFASYGEQLLDNDAPSAQSLTLPNPVDKPTASYGRQEQSYYATTYDKGAAALHAARAAAGPAEFDAALRCYVKTNAWRIANPIDVQRALVGLPAAVAVLKSAGALR